MADICVGLHRAFFVFGMFGLFGVLYDLDHLVVPLQKGIPITLDSVATFGTRILHFPILLVCGIVVCFLGACLGGLLFDAITVEMGCYKE